ncbi:MAG: EXS family-domain-containing protein [Benjaminiella poitrasii]|nr:MAG: EXS family-domain-containing protein [Benjaminiella poitrasii]
MYIDFSQSFDPLIPSELCPLILFVLIIAIFTCPFNILYYSSRKWLTISLFRIVLSYFFPIEFRDFFIADELNSLAYSFWTFSYFFCAYHWHWDDLLSNCPVKIFWYTPFVACLPPWWRFLQCIRRYQDSHEKVHLVNAIKYSTSIGATLATGYRRMYPNASMEIIWIVFCIINSSYTSVWDIKMDWGLLQPHSKHLLLRNELVFYRWTYYVAAPINVMLRFRWALNAASLGFKGELVGFVTAVLEAYRRLQWNFFRLENEHINNVGNYRAIKEIPLPFAFRDSDKTFVSHEEGAIQLPTEPHEISLPAAVITPTSFHEGLGTPVGSFYGRRDFEIRQDLDDAVSASDNIRHLKRQPSRISTVLDCIKTNRSTTSVVDSSASETEIDDEDEDEEDSD